VNGYKKKYHAIVEEEADGPEAELDVKPEGGKGKNRWILS